MYLSQLLFEVFTSPISGTRELMDYAGRHGLFFNPYAIQISTTRTPDEDKIPVWTMNIFETAQLELPPPHETIT